MNLLVQLLLSSNNFIAPIRMQKKKERERKEEEPSDFKPGTFPLSQDLFSK